MWRFMNVIPICRSLFQRDINCCEKKTWKSTIFAFDPILIINTPSVPNATYVTKYEITFSFSPLNLIFSSCCIFNLGSHWVGYLKFVLFVKFRLNEIFCGLQYWKFTEIRLCKVIKMLKLFGNQFFRNAIFSKSLFWNLNCNFQMATSRRDRSFYQKFYWVVYASAHNAMPTKKSQTIPMLFNLSFL